LEPVEDARLMETDAGDWTDRFFADVRAEDQERFDAFASADPGFGFPGGESFAEQEVRVEEALAEIAKGAKPALVVCHGMVIRAAMYRRLKPGGPVFTRVANAAIVPLDPELAAQAQLGGGEATQPS
jgi:broad specificity phosphatase PhoE